MLFQESVMSFLRNHIPHFRQHGNTEDEENKLNRSPIHDGGEPLF